MAPWRAMTPHMCSLPPHRRITLLPRLYEITDRSHQGRTVSVPASRIEDVVSAWLAELGVCGHLTADRSCAVRKSD
jgi:hypothetical protein